MPRHIAALTVLFLCLPIAATTEAQLFDTRIDYWVGEGPRSVAISDLDGDGNPDLITAGGFSLTGHVSVRLGNGDGTFQAAVNYDAGYYSSSVAIGDLDDDGDLDLAVTSIDSFYDDGYVSVLLGNGDGSFQAPVIYELWYYPQSVAIGDLDGDGNPDLAVASAGTTPPSFIGAVQILLGNGDGTFQAAVNYVAGDSPQSVAIDDLDGDGNPDLAVASRGTAPSYIGAVSILLGNGDGTFQAAVNYEAGTMARSVAIDDLDGDGNLDLAVATTFESWAYVSVLLGNGDGTFQTRVDYVVGYGSSREVAIGDLDSDGHPDLAVLFATYDNDDHTVSVLLGNGDGTFQEAVKYQTSNYPHSVAISDLDGDNILDLAVANVISANVSVLLGNGDGTFPEAVDYDAGDHPRSVAIGDLNGDGYPDLAVANEYSHTVSVLLGNRDGTFQTRVDYGVGESPYSVAIGDLDDDGNSDLAVANFNTDSVSVLLGNGDGTFQAAESYEVGNYARSIAIGDLNNDGNPDLAVAGPSVSVLLGNGDGTFQTRVHYYAGNFPFSVAIGDLDGNGNPDLAVADALLEKVFILLGNGDGSFQDAVGYDAGVKPQSIAIGDLDGDGTPDLVVTNDYSEVTVLLGNGDGTFPAAESYEVGYQPTSVAIGDLDGDSNADLAVVNYDNHNVSVLLGIGDGTFQAAINYGVGSGPHSVAIGDLDRNGSPDLVVANHDGNTVSVLINITGVFHRILAGPGPALENSPLVRVFPPDQDALPAYEFLAYGASQYGVNVTCGDVTGDGFDNILTGAGPGEIYGPHVRGFEVDGTPRPRLSFLAYGTNKYGVNVAAGDLDGDGVDEIITGAGPGAVFGPHVRGWSYTSVTGVTAIPGVNFFAYGTPKWGVNVACGDIDGDGFDEIVTGSGPGAVYGPHVRGWNVDGGTAMAMPGVSFFAYGTLKYGVNMTCGDVDGDDIDEIVTGAGPGAVFAPHVRGWNYDGASVAPLPGLSFFAWDDVRFGANVYADADLNGDSRAELVVGCGPDPDAGTEVKVFEYDGSGVTLWFSLESFEGMTHGTNVAAGRF